MFPILIRSFNPSILSSAWAACLGRSPRPRSRCLSTSLPDGGSLEAVTQNNLLPVPAQSRQRSLGLF